MNEQTKILATRVKELEAERDAWHRDSAEWERRYDAKNTDNAKLQAAASMMWEVLTALDLSVKWELAPEIKERIKAALAAWEATKK